MKPVTLCAITVVLLGLPSAAKAQVLSDGRQSPSAAPTGAAARQPGGGGSIEWSASVLWFAPTSLGARAANLTSNDTEGTPYALFTASGRTRGALGADTRVRYHLTRRIAVEGGIVYSRPAIDFTIANDAEGAPGFTATGEKVSMFQADASLVAYPLAGGLRGGRLRPFVLAGAGFYRELHGQSSPFSTYFASDSGQVFQAGGGLNYFFRSRPSGLVKAYGLRCDARLYVRSGGFTFDGHRPKTFAVGAGLVAAF